MRLRDDVSVKKAGNEGGKKPGIHVFGNIFGDNSPVRGELIQIDMPKKSAEGADNDFISLAESELTGSIFYLKDD